MNPLVKFTIENFEELISELARLNKPEYLFDLEDRIVDEITDIIRTKSKTRARAEILTIKNRLLEKIHSEPHVKPLLNSFQNAIDGATSAALYCL
ncbi:hypothetical protein HZC35_02885 [Candidatus Saganbacteria bacterium]|nr:hypothetical protein [Candidatus Saganbacteria bacterium]